MTKERFIVWCFAIAFVGFGSSYIIMGFGNSIDLDEGQGEVCRIDRLTAIDLAKSVLRGNLSIYKEPSRAGIFSGEGRGYVYPPLAGLIILPLVSLSGRLWQEGQLFEISVLPFVFLTGFTVLIMQSIMEKHINRKIALQEVLLLGIFLFSGMLFYAVVKLGKFEGVVAFLLLLGILFLPHRKVLSGICFGLALCTKQTAILAVIPTFFILFEEGNYRSLALWSSSLVAVVLIVFLPFLLVSGIHDTYFAMMKNSDLVKVQADTTIGYMYAIIRFLAGDEDRVIEKIFQFHINKLILLTCSLGSFILSRRNITTTKPEEYLALLTLCSFTYVILGKFYAVGHYEALPTYFFLLWTLISGEVIFGSMFLLLQSFLVCTWPSALFKKQLLLLLYFMVTFYVYKKSFGFRSHHESAPV